MIKIFTTNKNGKIELTKEELKEILDEAYWEGYKANTGITWTYKSPSITTPYYYTTSASGTTTTITLNNSAEANTATTSGKCDGITLTASNDNLNNTTNVSENEYNKKDSI